MILVDTSVIVAWLDSAHEHHERCRIAIERALLTDQPAVSAVTFAELAAGARTRDAVESALAPFQREDITCADAWRAGAVFGRQPGRLQTVLPDFFIRAQAAERGWPHLTNDERRTAPWQGANYVEFIFARNYG